MTPIIEDTVIPYKLPETGDHSFFYIEQRIAPHMEAKLHEHDAWELYRVVCGRGSRLIGDTVQPFSEGDTVLIPPSVPHYWKYDPGSADENGDIRYTMVAFAHPFVEKCIGTFPELRNRLSGIRFPAEAQKYGVKSSLAVGQALAEMGGMDELGRLSAMLRLLPTVFTATDSTFAGRPVRMERDIRRIQHICAYVMAHYVHDIALDDIAAEIGMNRSAFCSFFRRCKGMTFSRFVTMYRLNTACELLKHSQKQVTEICFTVGFNDLPHFVRVFTKTIGVPPTKYRKLHAPSEPEVRKRP